MELVEVKILGQVMTAQYGPLKTGDILRTNPEFARHLVEDCGAGEYANVKPAADSAPEEVEQAEQPNRTKK